MKKYSRQRETVLEVLQSVKTHPTASWIYDRARLEIPNISLGTVYRNLSELRKFGYIISFKTDDGNEHFDATTDKHYHFCCTECGKVIDLILEGTEELDSKAQKILDCEVNVHQLLFYGRCKLCMNSAKLKPNN